MTGRIASTGDTDRPLRGVSGWWRPDLESARTRPARDRQHTRAPGMVQHSPAHGTAIMLQHARRTALQATEDVAIDPDAALAHFRAARD